MNLTSAFRQFVLVNKLASRERKQAIIILVSGRPLAVRR